MIKVSYLSLDIEGAKNIHVLQVPILNYEGCCIFLTGVWHLNLHLDMVTGFYTTGFLSMALYLDFEGTKNIHVL